MSHWTMMQATELLGGGYEIAQYNDDGVRVRGVCEVDTDFWMEVLLRLLTEFEADGCPIGPCKLCDPLIRGKCHDGDIVRYDFEPTSQYADSREAAGI